MKFSKCFCAPCIFCCKVWNSGHKQYRLIKFICGFPIGFAMGIGIHYLIIQNLKMEEKTKFHVTLTLCLILAFGYGLSLQVRCMAILILPVLFSKTGRSIISALIIGMIISGPVANIVINAKESIRALSCSVSAGYNITKQIMEMKYKPIKNVLTDIMMQAPNIKSMSQEIKKNFSLVGNEVENEKETQEAENRTNDMDDKLEGWGRAAIIEQRYKEKQTKLATKTGHKGSFVENIYAKKQAFRCNDIFNLAAEKCTQAFKNMEKDCFKKIGVLGVTSVICLAFRVRKICNMLKLMPSTANKSESCDGSEDAVGPGFGEGFVEAEKTARDFDKNFDVDMKFQLASETEPLDLKTAEDVSKQIEHEFRIRQLWFEYIVSIVQRLMALLVLIIIKGAFDYSKGYIHDFYYDNCYITSYFVKIDERRKKQGKSHFDIMVSRKAFQFADLVWVWSPKIAKCEQKNVTSASIKIILDFITALLVIFLDRLFYEILGIVKNHSKLDVAQKGTHKILFHVYGNSVVAHIFRKLFRGFKADHHLDNVTSNEECLPSPRKLATRFIVNLILINVGALSMLYVQAYALRSRRLICSYFYPKREKQRILFLYNDLLRKKRTQFLYLKQKIIAEAKMKKLQQKTGILVSLRRYFPTFFFFVKYMKAGRKRCLLCQELENPKTQNFIPCPRNKGCSFGYCKECWQDLKQTCYACLSEERLKTIELDPRFATDTEDEK